MGSDTAMNSLPAAIPNRCVQTYRTTYKLQTLDNMNIKTSLFFVLLFGLFSCNQTDKIETKVSISTDNFIKPPINGVDVPYKEYSVDAAKGDTLFYKTGSIILFPPNSFVDKDGNVIQGNVQVKYREFSNPIGFYLSGIPMNYDSAGKSYTFESSGMCEVLAYKDGVPVFVNPKSKPEINLVSDNNSQTHNLYYLDTVQKKWIDKGISIVTELNSLKSKTQGTETTASNELTEPLKPEKASSKSPVIKIIIDPASFKELLVYDNLQFQLEANEKNFNPKDTIDEWSNVELLKGKSKGLYTVKFSNAKRTVSYSARPVLEGNDYDKALKIFEKNNAEYKNKINERQNKEKASKEQYLRDSLSNQKVLDENKRIEKLNILIEARNKGIEKQNAIVDKQNKLYTETSQSNKIMRSFQIDGFGIWNCDKAISLNCLPIAASFKNEKGDILDLTNIAVLYKSFNGILKFPDNKILVVKDAENMIIGIHNGMFAYLNYEDYNKLKIIPETKEQTFIMTVLSEKDNNYDYIKKVAGRQ